MEFNDLSHLAALIEEENQKRLCLEQEGVRYPFNPNTLLQQQQHQAHSEDDEDSGDEHLEDSTMATRKRKSEREKDRRSNMNGLFARLEDLLGLQTDNKSKIEVLQHARDFLVFHSGPVYPTAAVAAAAAAPTSRMSRTTTSFSPLRDSSSKGGRSL
ncbi:hypothetical protein BASA81_006875 [Batrachochytrium salamandrivorans]|nr:hypothetical protein BASA81_006875 [Batrachochytrium salamandrivorans]